MRNHESLKAFQLADLLALAVYKATATFPKDERFGLTAQLRKAAVSCVSNIVEGAARNTEADFLHFLDMAIGSGREVEYQLSLAQRLGFLSSEAIKSQSREVCMVLSGLIQSLRSPRA
ncbi:MAG: four helix bundle protein [Holophagaceae bacterium]|nr:four helix bundle protein [Holophagaceae bacterium]